MLILTRHVGERVIIGDGVIVVTVVEVRGNKVRIGFEAPADIRVHREEIQKRVEEQGSKRPQ